MMKLLFCVVAIIMLSNWLEKLVKLLKRNTVPPLCWRNYADSSNYPQVRKISQWRGTIFLVWKAVDIILAKSVSLKVP
jgi:hypothetical protein